MLTNFKISRLKLLNTFRKVVARYKKREKVNSAVWIARRLRELGNAKLTAKSKKHPIPANLSTFKAFLNKYISLQFIAGLIF